MHRFNTISATKLSFQNHELEILHEFLFVKMRDVKLTKYALIWQVAKLSLK